MQEGHDTLQYRSIILRRWFMSPPAKARANEVLQTQNVHVPPDLSLLGLVTKVVLHPRAAEPCACLEPQRILEAFMKCGVMGTTGSRQLKSMRTSLEIKVHGVVGGVLLLHFYTC